MPYIFRFGLTLIFLTYISLELYLGKNEQPAVFYFYIQNYLDATLAKLKKKFT